MTDELKQWEYDKGYEKGKKDGAIEELKTIKAEIEEHNRKYLSDDNAGLERAIWDFIEPHISELKGENKSEREDTEFNHEAFYEFLLNAINPNEMENYRSMFLSNGEIVK